MHEKLTANITLNDEILNTSLLGSGTQTREGYVLLSFLFSSILEVPASCRKARKRNKGHTDWKGRNKTVPRKMKYIIVQVENLEESTEAAKINKLGKQWKQLQNLFSWAPKSLQMVTAAMKLKDVCSLEENL